MIPTWLKYNAKHGDRSREYRFLRIVFGLLDI